MLFLKCEDMFKTKHRLLHDSTCAQKARIITRSHHYADSTFPSPPPPLHSGSMPAVL